MSHEAWRERGPTSTRWRSRTYDSESLDFLPAKSGPIIEAPLVDELAEEFNRWLCAVLLLLWHVNIVDKDEELCVALHSVHLFALLADSGLDIRLRILALRLSAKVELAGNDRVLFIGAQIFNELLDDHRLARACAPCHKDGLVHRCHHVEKCGNLLGVDRGNHKLEEGSWLAWVFESGQLCLVVNELELLSGIDHVIVDSVESRDLMLSKEVSHRVVQETHR